MAVLLLLLGVLAGRAGETILPLFLYLRERRLEEA
jgi:hypothetical protein